MSHNRSIEHLCWYSRTRESLPLLLQLLLLVECFPLYDLRLQNWVILADEIHSLNEFGPSINQLCGQSCILLLLKVNIRLPIVDKYCQLVVDHILVLDSHFHLRMLCLELFDVFQCPGKLLCGNVELQSQVLDRGAIIRGAAGSMSVMLGAN